MKKDLRSFAGMAQKAEKIAETMGNQTAAEQLKRFEGKSEEELFSELMREVNKGKAEGTFNAEKLSGFVRQVSPMLNAEQKKRLSELIARIQ